MRNVSILGDSISTFTGVNPAGFTVFYTEEYRAQHTVKRPEDTWWHQVIAGMGGTLLKNGSYSGSTVAGAGFPAATSPERIAALAGADGTQPDDIVVFIGINDYGWGGSRNQAVARSHALPTATDLTDIPAGEAGPAAPDAVAEFEQAYTTLLAELRRAYPAAHVWACTLCPARVEGAPRATFAYNLRGAEFDDYCDAIRHAAHATGATVVDIRSFGRDYEAADGTHPTARGMRQLSAMMLTAMGGAPRAGFDDAPASERTCTGRSCMGCPFARGTGNAWFCVCERPEGVPVPPPGTTPEVRRPQAQR